MNPPRTALALAALTAAGCGAGKPPQAPQPAVRGPAAPAGGTGLQIAADTPASYRKWLAEQYAALPPAMRVPVRVRVASPAEIGKHQNPGSPGGAAVLAYGNDAAKREILLSRVEFQARLVFLHEYGHLTFYTHLYPKARHLEFYDWWDKGGGRPVALYWREQRDRNGLHGNPYEGWAHAFLWATYPKPKENTFFGGKPCPAGLAAKVRSYFGP